MSTQDIKPGTKTAKAVAAQIIKSASGSYRVEVRFGFQEDNEAAFIKWRGFLTPKTLERTMQTLTQTLGFNGDQTVDDEGYLTHPRALDYDRPVSLVVEMETFTGKDGVERTLPAVKWVNPISKKPFETVSPEIIQNDLNALGFQAAYLSAKGSAAVNSAVNPSDGNVEADLPF